MYLRFILLTRFTSLLDVGLIVTSLYRRHDFLDAQSEALSDGSVGLIVTDCLLHPRSLESSFAFLQIVRPSLSSSRYRPELSALSRLWWIHEHRGMRYHHARQVRYSVYSIYIATMIPNPPPLFPCLRMPSCTYHFVILSGSDNHILTFYRCDHIGVHPPRINTLRGLRV